MNTSLRVAFAILFVFVIVFSSAPYDAYGQNVFAEPQTDFPNGNPAAPLDGSSQAQQKVGPLRVGGDAGAPTAGTSILLERGALKLVQDGKEANFPETNFSILNFLNPTIYSKGLLSLDVKGLRLPNLLTSEVPDPKAGTLIFDKNTNDLQLYDGTKWGGISGGGGLGDQYWQLVQPNQSQAALPGSVQPVRPKLSPKNSDVLVGIGTSDPTARLEVKGGDVKVTDGKLCLGLDCRNTWPSGTGGTGSDIWKLTGTEIAPLDSGAKTVRVLGDVTAKSNSEQAWAYVVMVASPGHPDDPYLQTGDPRYLATPDCECHTSATNKDAVNCDMQKPFPVSGDVASAPQYCKDPYNITNPGIPPSRGAVLFVKNVINILGGWVTGQNGYGDQIGIGGDISGNDLEINIAAPSSRNQVSFWNRVLNKLAAISTGKIYSQGSHILANETDASKQLMLGYFYNDKNAQDYAYITTYDYGSHKNKDLVVSASNINLNAQKLLLNGKELGVGGGGSSQWSDVAGGIAYKTGKVGVGTDNPSGIFDVVGNGNVYLKKGSLAGTVDVGFGGLVDLDVQGDIKAKTLSVGGGIYFTSAGQSNIETGIVKDGATEGEFLDKASASWWPSEYSSNQVPTCDTSFASIDCQPGTVLAASENIAKYDLNVEFIRKGGVVNNTNCGLQPTGYTASFYFCYSYKLLAQKYVSKTVSGSQYGGRVIANKGDFSYLGINTNDPKEALQFGDAWTFHNGGQKIIGYNFYFDGDKDRRLIADETSNLAFTNDGDIYFRFGGKAKEGTEITDWKTGVYMRNVDGGVKTGINTYDPDEIFEVANVAPNEKALKLSGSKNNTNYIFAVPQLGSGGYNNLAKESDVGLFYPDSSGFILGPWSNSTKGLRISQSGYIGVNTNNPQQRLDIRGDVAIRAGSDQLSGTGYWLEELEATKPSGIKLPCEGEDDEVGCSDFVESVKIQDSNKGYDEYCKSRFIVCTDTRYRVYSYGTKSKNVNYAGNLALDGSLRASRVNIGTDSSDASLDVLGSARVSTLELRAPRTSQLYFYANVGQVNYGGNVPDELLMYCDEVDREPIVGRPTECSLTYEYLDNKSKPVSAESPNVLYDRVYEVANDRRRMAYKFEKRTRSTESINTIFAKNADGQDVPWPFVQDTMISLEAGTAGRATQCQNLGKHDYCALSYCNVTADHNRPAECRVDRLEDGSWQVCATEFHSDNSAKAGASCLDF